jgi:hypothetical protein
VVGCINLPIPFKHIAHRVGVKVTVHWPVAIDLALLVPIRARTVPKGGKLVQFSFPRDGKVFTLSSKKLRVFCFVDLQAMKFATTALVRWAFQARVRHAITPQFHCTIG